MSNELVRLRQFIVEYYDLDELRTLCFDLGVRYEELGEGGLTARVRQLLLLLGREHRLDELLAALQDGRGELLQQAGFSENPALLDMLYTALPAFQAEAGALTPRPRDQQILLEKVKTFWVEGVLEKSLHHAALIELVKEVRPYAVDYLWEMVVQSPDQESYILPPNRHVVAVFDDSGQSLLILGAPGSGKTTMLLELARATIARAEQDRALPVPVVFNLSSWRGTESIGDWLVNELNQKYLIPKRIGRGWVKSDRLVLLLDGLDEVAPARQSACVAALNDFRHEHLAGMAICSRSEAYESLSDRLKLQSAIFLQPFTAQQVDTYLAAGGARLTALRSALQSDETLQEMARSPLMLSVMALAYRDLPFEEVSRRHSNAIRWQHLFPTYVQQMFKRRGVANNSYSPGQSVQWLSWLARQMSERGQSVFLIEQLQPDWLPPNQPRWFYTFGSRILGGLGVGLATGLAYWLFSERVGGLIGGVALGLIGGLVTGLMDSSWLTRSAAVVHRTTTGWHPARHVFSVGLLVALVVGFSMGVFWSSSLDLLAGLFFGLLAGPFYGVIFGFLFGLRRSRQDAASDIRPVEALGLSGKGAIKGLIWGLIVGLAFGLSIVVISLVLSIEVAVSLRSQVAVFFSSLGALTGAMLGGLSGRTVETKSLPNQGIRLSFRNAAFAGLSFIVGITVVSLLTSVSFGLSLSEAVLAWMVSFGLLLGLLAALWYGGLDVIQHYALRFILWRSGHMPWNYARFLDYVAERLFLRRVGGGYIFVHRLLLEYFAAVEQPVDGV